jgi:hypothetical protein
MLAGKMPARTGKMPAEEEEGRSGGRWTGEPLPRERNAVILAAIFEAEKQHFQ